MAFERKKDNFLDYVPKHNALFPYKKKKSGNIEVRVHNRGLFCRLTQILFQKPKYSYIMLDEFGSFVWEQIDGERNLYEIGKLVKERFGAEAEPLYERLSEFIKILRRNDFILYRDSLFASGAKMCIMIEKGRKEGVK